MKMRGILKPAGRWPRLLPFAIAFLSCTTRADWTQARCEIFAADQPVPTAVLPCVFSQRQGYITIDRSDGISLDLEPLPDGPGNYRDQQGRKVIRKRNNDNNSQVFHTEDSIVKVFWTVTQAKAASEPGSAFDETLVLQGISFRISSPNNTSLSPVKIEVAGLELGPTMIERVADGVIAGAEVADLDVNGSPELYIYTTSAGSGSYGNLIAYAVNNGKSISEIYLPPLTESDVIAAGYRGHDEFAIVENTLARRFPLYRAEDTNAEASGGTRQLKYELQPGEAGWILRQTGVIDY